MEIYLLLLFFLHGFQLFDRLKREFEWRRILFLEVEDSYLSWS